MQDPMAGNCRREAGRTRNGLTGRTLSPGKPGEFYFPKLFRFSLAISDNEIILHSSDTSLTHNTHKGTNNEDSWNNPSERSATGSG